MSAEPQEEEDTQIKEEEAQNNEEEDVLGSSSTDDEESEEEETDDDGDEEDEEENGDEVENDEDEGSEEEDDDEEEEEDSEEDEEVEEDEEPNDDAFESSSGDENCDRCPICLNRLRNQDFGTPESCDHCFCLECIQEWSKVTNTCPVDRQVFNIILARHAGEEKIFKQIPVENNKQGNEEEEDDPTFCEVCGQSDREDRLLLCDGCDLGYHCDCLDPPLSRVPVQEWFCPDCQDRRNAALVEEPHYLGRQIARTRISERVRRIIADARAERAERRRRIAERIDADESFMDEEPTPGTSAATRSTTTPAKRKTTRKRKTTKRKTTRKRKTTKRKTKRKSTGKKRRKRKTKGKRKRRTSKKTKKTLSPGLARTARAVTSVKGRIADKLGLSKPPVGRSIPLQKVPAGTKQEGAGRVSTEYGASAFSILGSKDDLYLFADQEGEERQIVHKPAIPVETLLSRSAKSSHLPLNFSTPKKKVVKELPVLASVSTSASTGTFDILGSIMQKQDLLHKGSQHVTINRDGSLSANSSSQWSPKKVISTPTTSSSSPQKESPSKSRTSQMSISSSPGTETGPTVSPYAQISPSCSQRSPSITESCGDATVSAFHQPSNSDDELVEATADSRLLIKQELDDNEQVLPEKSCLPVEASHKDDDVWNHANVAVKQEIIDTDSALNNGSQNYVKEDAVKIKEEKTYTADKTLALKSPQSLTTLKLSGEKFESKHIESFQDNGTGVMNCGEVKSELDSNSSEDGRIASQNDELIQHTDREEGEATDSDDEGGDNEINKSDDDQEEGEIVDDEEEKKPVKTVEPAATLNEYSKKRAASPNELTDNDMNKKKKLDVDEGSKSEESNAKTQEEEEEEDDEDDDGPTLGGPFALASFLTSLKTNEFDRKKELAQKQEEERKRKEEEEEAKKRESEDKSKQMISILDFIGNESAKKFGIPTSTVKENKGWENRGSGFHRGGYNSFDGGEGFNNRPNTGWKQDNNWPNRRWSMNGDDAQMDGAPPPNRYMDRKRPGSNDGWRKSRSGSQDMSEMHEGRSSKFHYQNGMEKDRRRKEHSRSHRSRSRSPKRKSKRRKSRDHDEDERKSRHERKRKKSKWIKEEEEEEEEKDSSEEDEEEEESEGKPEDQVEEKTWSATTANGYQAAAEAPPPPPGHYPPAGHAPPSYYPPPPPAYPPTRPGMAPANSYGHSAHPPPPSHSHGDAPRPAVPHPVQHPYHPSMYPQSQPVYPQPPAGAPRPPHPAYPSTYYQHPRPMEAAPRAAAAPGAPLRPPQPQVPHQQVPRPTTAHPPHPHVAYPARHPAPVPAAHIPAGSVPHPGYQGHPQVHPYAATSTHPAYQQRPTGAHPRPPVYTGVPATAAYPPRPPAIPQHSQPTSSVPQRYAYTTPAKPEAMTHSAPSASLSAASRAETAGHTRPDPSHGRSEQLSHSRSDTSNAYRSDSSLHMKSDSSHLKGDKIRKVESPQLRKPASYRISPPSAPFKGITTYDKVDSSILLSEVKKGFRQLVEDAVRCALKPAWSSRKITKDEYKDIFKRAVEKVCGSKETVVHQEKIQSLVSAYVIKARKARTTSS
ncbi:PHD and RING finger domain-containing protein 1-like isoform X1 [Physella acuta]|uniref:PHD and RING finger domain-containing protein 1-like isoform X1 n=1 Tax=Physella acuta TaxID=109671 RepID=UPI0027DDCA11|nr:PHD and RING finger domain-containing protein 1-like isoform X1 [Physella acuta]